MLEKKLLENTIILEGIFTNYTKTEAYRYFKSLKKINHTYNKNSFDLIMKKLNQVVSGTYKSSSSDVAKSISQDFNINANPFFCVYQYSLELYFLSKFKNWKGCSKKDLSKVRELESSITKGLNTAKSYTDKILSFTKNPQIIKAEVDQAINYHNKHFTDSEKIKREKNKIDIMFR